MARAAKGGEAGTNGFWYEGGQFLPSTRLAKMSKIAKKAIKTYMTTKQQVSAWGWECPGDIGVRSLWPLCSLALTPSNGGMAIIPDAKIEELSKGMGWPAGSAEEIKAQAQRWINGERWISQDEAPMGWWAEVKQQSQ